MDSLKHFFHFLFSSKYRRVIRTEEINYLQEQINYLEKSIPQQYDRVREIHKNPVDKGTEHEQKRRRRRYAEIEEDKELLDRLRNREKKLKKKLGLKK